MFSICRGFMLGTYFLTSQVSNWKDGRGEPISRACLCPGSEMSEVEDVEGQSQPLQIVALLTFYRLLDRPP